MVRTTYHKLKITYCNITLTYETWLGQHYVATSMISGGSRRFDAGAGQLLFQLRKFQKWVLSVLSMDREIYEGSGPKLPLDPPLASLMEVANVDSIV